MATPQITHADLDRLAERIEGRMTREIDRVEKSLFKRYDELYARDQRHEHRIDELVDGAADAGREIGVLKNEQAAQCERIDELAERRSGAERRQDPPPSRRTRAKTAGMWVAAVYGIVELAREAVKQIGGLGQ